MIPQLALAYQECRAIAKREAKNFYYAFVALPRHKSDAMCAIYAFMRRADDLSDDESISIPERRVAMQQWLDAWRAARAGSTTTDSIFLAVNDTQKRFAIPDELLEQLVRGTTMDLEENIDGVVPIMAIPAGMISHQRAYQAYESFDDLYRYCYLVASVVGLVCIRIFGYTDPRAERFAEETGIAFQLTNILRDVREDAERGRLYLPLEDMQSAGADVTQILSATHTHRPSQPVLALMQLEIERARAYYQAADQLIPLLDRDSRAAMKVLASIYHGLLERVARDPAKVFVERVSVPTSVKLTILLGGMGKSFINRAFSK
ncbi:phytoene/squalene synthase family protein [Terriglobus saanensis]|uniref:Phytoene synthase n=1 Tax=Terriglobus saanensis (strain ATCC BAA-1853 / DSM 23119 / SP1PR4) TaxID=401053 RepID=E8V5Q3_TERSS|nr:phytoene/squalene synthase family protein [Terriglobus saanensis]ADV82662.1 Phytoene synthase [Terriglobus saanensis SP1PR4]